MNKLYKYYSYMKYFMNKIIYSSIIQMGLNISDIYRIHIRP